MNIHKIKKKNMLALKLSLLLCCLTTVTLASDKKGLNWAILVAGSDGFYNYRHQADVCHAYQVIHAHGIPDERVIVMMQDDIAYNELNPNKGVLINRPNGPNVYKNVPKDYTGNEVSYKNFLDVLSGKKSQKLKKVIDSGPDDNIFVYFTDHGAPGLVAFPNGRALHAKVLNQTIYEMYQNKRYKNMVIYMEACESGSMFDNILPNNINVYATTAANDKESSYATYYDDKLQTFLGDLYSVSWMENSDSQNIFKESLIDQFKLVKTLTNRSHVEEFGNLTMGSSFFVSDFQSNGNMTQALRDDNQETPRISAILDTVRTEDVREEILQRKLSAEINPIKRIEIKKQINEAIKIKKTATQLIRRIAMYVLGEDREKIVEAVRTRKPLRDHDCYMQIVDYFIDKCIDLNNEYVLRHLYVFVNLCEMGVKSGRVVSAIDYFCPMK